MKLNIKNTIYYSSKVKYLGINLTEFIQDLNAAKYKTLMKQIKDQIKWRDIL